METTTAENLLGSLRLLEELLKTNFMGLKGQTSVKLNVLQKDLTVIDPALIKDRIFYKDFGNFLGFVHDENSWKEKIGTIMKFRRTGPNFISIFTSKNNDTRLTPVSIGQIYFRVNNEMSGEIDLIHEFRKEVLVKEFAITQYHIGKKSFSEIAASWEDAVNLVSVSASDFITYPEAFERVRIKNN